MTWYRCLRCRRPLDDPESRRRGYGRACDPNPNLRQTPGGIRTSPQHGDDLLQQLQEDHMRTAPETASTTPPRPVDVTDPEPTEQPAGWAEGVRAGWRAALTGDITAEILAAVRE